MSDAAASSGEPAGDSDAQAGGEVEVGAAGETPAPKGPSRRHGAVMGALSAAAVALITLSAVFGVQWSSQHAQAQSRQAALQAARQTVIDLTNLSGKNAEQDVQRLLRGTTGPFRKQFGAKRREAFIKLLQQAHVTTTGRVVAAGIARADEDSARVLVAVDSQVTNTAVPKGQPRSYRFAVSLQRQNGKWLASNLEFVT